MLTENSYGAARRAFQRRTSTRNADAVLKWSCVVVNYQFFAAENIDFVSTDAFFSAPNATVSVRRGEREAWLYSSRMSQYTLVTPIVGGQAEIKYSRGLKYKMCKALETDKVYGVLSLVDGPCCCY